MIRLVNSEQPVTTRDHNHNVPRYPPQRAVATPHRQHIAPPQDHAASLIHGHKHLISVLQGRRYLRSGQNRLHSFRPRQIASSQLRRRHVAAPNSERLLQGFSGKCPTPLSLWILPPLKAWAQDGCLADIDARPPLQATPLQATGISPFLGIFLALPRPVFGLDFGYQPKDRQKVTSGLGQVHEIAKESSSSRRSARRPSNMIVRTPAMQKIPNLCNEARAPEASPVLYLAM